MKNFQELMLTISQLNDSDFIKEQGLSEDDIKEIRSNFEKEKENYRADFKEYAVYKLQQRQENQILMDWTEEEISRLTKLQGWYETNIKSTDRRLESLMHTFGLEELLTPIWKLKFTNSKKLWVSDDLAHWLPEDLLGIIPVEFLKYKLEDDIDDVLSKKLIEAWCTVSKWLWSKALITAWIKSLDDETVKELSQHIQIRENKNFKIK